MERRLAELDELFEPAQAVYGESYMERLWEDEELSAKMRERFERGKTAGKFPALSDLLSNLSAKEKEIFFKTGGMQAMRFRGIVPEDVGVRFRQLRGLLMNEPEFIVRYPEAHGILLAHEAQRTELGGFPLPSFGVHVLGQDPYPYYADYEDFATERERDAYSTTYVPGLKVGHPSADQSFWPLEAGLLRGTLLTILSREEYRERIKNHRRDLGLFEDVEVPEEWAVRITDLRLAKVLVPEETRRFLLPALRSLQKPITAERVVEWKHQIIGNKGEDELDRCWEEFGAQLRQRWRAFTVSFAAAALFLFMDLDMPGVRDEKPFRLAEQISELAEIIKRLMRDLDDRTQELEKLVANRSAGRQSRRESDAYHALCYWRYGHNPEAIARWLGITPYSSKAGTGTRDWKTKLNRILVQGKEVENKRYPRAAAIFANYKDSSHIRRKAHRAYRAHLVMINRFPGHPPIWEVGRKIRVNHQKRRGLEVIQAYVQLGSCLARGRPTSP